MGRFSFEFLRGDSCRPYFFGFSEAQWISLLLIVVVTWAGWMWHYDSFPWHAVVTLGVVSAMIVVVFQRRWRKTATHQLLQPQHIQEVAETLAQHTSTVSTGSAALFRERVARVTIPVWSTSLGVQISVSQFESATGRGQLYSLSNQNGSMTEEAARILSHLILQLKSTTGSSEFLQGNGNIFHLLVHQGARLERSSTPAFSEGGRP